MQRSDGNGGGDATEGSGSFSVDRRSYLKLAGVAAGSVPMLSGAASAAFTRRGITFKRSVDMVRGAGCDPTGREPCDRKIQEAADDYTLLKFPAGEYKLTEKNVVLDATNVGFLGEGDVSFVVPERFNEKALVVDKGTGLLFENIDIDQRADGATPGLHLGVDDDLQVHDVELIGQGIHPDSLSRSDPGWSPGGANDNGNPNVMDFFYPIVRSPDGTGVVSNLKANNHGLMGSYNAGDGRSGIWVGVENYGTIRFEDCHMEEFGSNGTYTSRTYGVVQFEGGVYRNNDNNQIRLGSTGSYIDGAILDVDADSSDAPNPYEALNYRGARVELGRIDNKTDVAIRNCDIAIRSASHSGGGVVAEGTASQFHVENTRISVDVDGVRGILGKVPDGNSYEPPAKPHSGTFENVSITGSASNNAAIELLDRPDSIVDGCCIHQEGGSRDGVRLADSDGSRVRNSTIDVTGRPIAEHNSRVSTGGNSESGSCPAPKYGAGDSLPRKISFEGSSGRFEYAFSVSGDLGKSTARGATIDPNDSVSGSTASGNGGRGGVDSYGFSGTIESLRYNSDVDVTVNGKRIYGSNYPNNVLSIEGTGQRANYDVSVSNHLEKSTANGASISGRDSISGSTASGYVSVGTDSYVFSGDIESLSYDNRVRIFLNGERIYGSNYPNNVITFASNGGRFSYNLRVSGSLGKSNANGASVDDSDSISGQSASGQGGNGGADSYVFSGDIQVLQLDGDATVTINGNRIDPDEYGKNILTLASNGGHFEYAFSVSGDLEHSSTNGASIDPNDTISGSTASGNGGGGGADSYIFTGDIESFQYQGSVTATLNGRRIYASQYPDNVISIHGTGPHANYDFSVSDHLEKSTANGGSVSGRDSISRSTASGYVSVGTDSYVFSGDIESLSYDNRVRIFLNGERIYGSNYPNNAL